MKNRSQSRFGEVRIVHPYAWLWEPLADDPAFVLRSFFGGKAVYLDGKLMLHLTAHAEPWRGMLVCTERDQHPALIADFPDLVPHPILPKWLYLTEAAETFESTASRLIKLARCRDPRIGIIAKPQKRRTKLVRPR